MNSDKLSIGGQLPHDIPNTAATPRRNRVKTAAAATDGTWAYAAAAYETLLYKAALVLLSPLGVKSNELESLTDQEVTRKCS
jgi:hypothetical protein